MKYLESKSVYFKVFIVTYKIEYYPKKNKLILGFYKNNKYFLFETDFLFQSLVYFFKNIHRNLHNTLQFNSQLNYLSDTYSVLHLIRHVFFSHSNTWLLRIADKILFDY